MFHSFALVVALCAGCGNPQQPAGLRSQVPVPNVDVSISDGCARFQVRFDAGGAPIVEPIYNTSSCPLNELRLLSDTAATFNATTGALRVAVVMENVGTDAVVARVKLRFNADSVIRRDANGTLVGGASNIRGYQPDSSDATGRTAFWWYDTFLAAVGQPQVLMPGAKTRRRWIEFRGTTWTAQVRPKLFATGVEMAVVPAVAPDSVPRGLMSDSNIVGDPDAPGVRYVRGIVGVLFKIGATQAQRQAAVAAVGGIVVGGSRAGGADGFYLVRLLSDTSVRAPKTAGAVLRGLPQVDWAGEEIMTARPLHLRPHDAAGFQSWKVSTGGGSAPGTTWALEDIAGPLLGDAPLVAPSQPLRLSTRPTSPRRTCCQTSTKRGASASVSTHRGRQGPTEPG